MTFKDLARWNIRASALYAAGIWTMISSYAYFKYKSPREDEPDVAKKEEEVPDSENPNQVVYKGAHYKSVIIYKEGFVPYTTRIYNFIQSFSSEPGSGDTNK